MATRTTRSKTEKVGKTSSKVVMVAAYGDEDMVLEEQEVHVFETEPAMVRVNAGVTKNLGNYESLRVDVAISVPCYAEMVDDTFDAIAEQVSELLADEVENYLDSKG